MTATAYVWQHLPGQAEPVLAGRFRWTRTVAGSARGEFRYAPGYPDLPGALPLDPIVLPLSAGRRDVVTADLGGWFSVIRDALPDSWGRQLLARLYGTMDEPHMLTRLRGDQVGALSFSSTRDAPPAPAPPLRLKELAGIADALAMAEADTSGAVPDAQALQRMLTASGGARPKLTVEHDGALWLAKLPSARDPRGEPSMPALECATLDLAQHVGLTVPRHELVRIGDQDVLLIERFDRSPVAGFDGAPPPPAWARHRYASARTLLWSEPEGARYSATGSYPALATQLARWSTDARTDRLELFLRVAFNCLVSNTDDHDLNHGVVDTGGGFRLAPAFDLVPQPVTTNRQYLAMVVGADGAAATRANLLSSARRFGLTAGDAAGRLDAMASAVRAGWKDCLYGRGISGAHLERLAPRFAPGHFF